MHARWTWFAGSVRERETRNSQAGGARRIAVGTALALTDYPWSLARPAPRSPTVRGDRCSCSASAVIRRLRDAGDTVSGSVRGSWRRPPSQWPRSVLPNSAPRSSRRRSSASSAWPPRLSDGEGLHELLGGRGEDLQDVAALLP